MSLTKMAYAAGAGLAVKEAWNNHDIGHIGALAALLGVGLGSQGHRIQSGLATGAGAAGGAYAGLMAGRDNWRASLPLGLAGMLAGGYGGFRLANPRQGDE